MELHLQLQKSVDKKLESLGTRTADAQKIVQYLYKKPIIDAVRISEITKKSSASVYKLISILEELEILKEVTGQKRGKLYSFESYVKLFKP